MRFSALVASVVAFGMPRCCHGRETTMEDTIHISADDEAPDSQQHRNLLFQKIWDYTPRTKITDIAALDLDLQTIKKLLDQDDFPTAKLVYEDGGHAGSTAVLTLDVSLDRDIPAGTDVLIPSGNNDDTGWGSLAIDASRGDLVLLITYGTTVNREEHVGCQVGALPEPVVHGCFVASGTINFPDLGKTYEYSYDVLTENINMKDFLDLAVTAKNLQDSGNFFKYKDYFGGSEQYLDEITTAGFNKRETQFSSSGRNMDFSVFQNAGNKEVIELSILLMTVWMTVIGNLETAVDKCFEGTCTGDICLERPGVFEWDSAVAYYSGSRLEVSGSKGNMLFNHADERCLDMRTCGESGTLKAGNAFINHEIFRHFRIGQRDLAERYCKGAQSAKDKIVELMAVPLIQGAIRYAHIVEAEGTETLERLEKHTGEAAAYAIAVAPLVHHCNPDDAAIIMENLKPRVTPAASFSAVKGALERNYHCMKVKCHHVGGIYNDFRNAYREGAEPCNDLTVGLTDQQKKWAISLGISFGGIFLIAIVVCIVGRTERPMVEPKNNDLQLQANTDAEIS